jgi:hypothetical protein
VVAAGAGARSSRHSQCGGIFLLFGTSTLVTRGNYKNYELALVAQANEPFWLEQHPDLLVA